MIINVGGRTDIVNYYTPWLINRLKEGYVYVRNPYHPQQITEYDLSPEKIDAMIFCSKNYRPILKYMDNIKKKYPIFCYYTITAYGEDVEAKVPSIDKSIEYLKELSDKIGQKRVAWRYDPILLTERYTIDRHLQTFEEMTSKLHDKVSFCVFSFVDMYNKVYKNMPEITELDDEDEEELLEGLTKIANKYDMPLQSCAADNKYEKYGIRNSGCITKEILEESNSIILKDIKTKGKRMGCKCLPWRDIGEYDTCLNGCKYCYANKRPDIAIKKYEKHDPQSPVLIGQIKKNDKINPAKQVSFIKMDSKQQKLI